MQLIANITSYSLQQKFEWNLLESFKHSVIYNYYILKQTF